MNTWLAIVVFCMNGECAFMVSNKEVLASQDECVIKVNEYVTMLMAQGFDEFIPTCVPLKYKVS